MIAISIYCYLLKWVISAKPLRIRFDKINGFIKICDRIRYLGYLVLFGHMWYDEMCNRIRYNLKKAVINSINSFIYRKIIEFS